MNRTDCEEMERVLDKMIVKRRGLGGYSHDAADLLILAEFQRAVVRHFKERLPRSKRDADD